MTWNLWRHNGKLSFLIDMRPRRLRAAKLALARLTSQAETERKSLSQPPENQPLQTFFPASVFHGSLLVKSWPFEQARVA